MANFVVPKVKSAHVDYMGQMDNNPVNIDLCTELIKNDRPTGYGSKNPVIRFEGCGVIWYYNEGDYKRRDEQYNLLL